MSYNPDTVYIIEQWMKPYWSEFIESKHSTFGIWICKYINKDNIMNVYKWYCKHYNHDHFILYVPIFANEDDQLDVVSSFVKKLLTVVN